MGYYATCHLLSPTFDGGGKLSQVVDESQFPGWNPNGNSKTVDVTASIWLDPRTGIRFRLGSWSSYFGGANPLDDPITAAAVQYTDWVEFTNPNATATGWFDVHPFDQYLYGAYQPRWVRLDMQFLQPAGFGRVDDVTLVGKCNDPTVPEPISLILGALGFGFLGGLGRFKR